MQDNCLHKVIKEFSKKGICNNGPTDFWFGENKNPFNWPSRQCEIDNRGWITEGVCSDKLENLFSLRRECAFSFRAEKNLLVQTLSFLMRSMCKTEKVFNLLTARRPFGSATSRLVPIESVLEYQDAVVSTNLNLGKRGL